VMGWFLKSYIQTIVAARRRGLPVIVRGDSQVTMHSPRWRAAAKAAIFPVALRAFSAALYVGERSRDFYRHYGYPEARLFPSPHCVDTDWFRAQALASVDQPLRAELGIGPDEAVVLFAGKLESIKRPLDLVAAAQRVRAGRPLNLVFAGAGPLEAEIRQAAAEGSTRVHMLGFRNQSEMPRIYAGADVLCLPSEHETWGLVANEALACGTPIVVSDTCGCSPDLAADGQAGVTFKKADIDALGGALERILSIPPSDEAVLARSERYSVRAARQGVMSAVEYVGAGRPSRSTR
jgi:glycosyltransferase involved in cell wall biosynthesis